MADRSRVENGAELRAVALCCEARETGTYAVSGSTVTLRPIVAKGPNTVVINEQFRIEADTLTLTWAPGDALLKIGQDMVRSTGAASNTRMTLTRVE